MNDHVSICKVCKEHFDCYCDNIDCNSGICPDCGSSHDVMCSMCGDGCECSCDKDHSHYFLCSECSSRTNGTNQMETE